VTARATRFLSDLRSRYSAARLIEDGELKIEGLGPVIAVADMLIVMSAAGQHRTLVHRKTLRFLLLNWVSRRSGIDAVAAEALWPALT